MTRLRWAIAAAAVLLLIVAGYCHFSGSGLPTKQAKLQERYSIQTRTLKDLTVVNDSALKGNDSMPKAQARVIVAGERRACKAKTDTCEKRVANLQKQLKVGWLKVFAEADYAIPGAQPVLEGTLSARVGASVRVRRGTAVQGYYERPLLGTGQPSYHLGVRQEFRIF